MAPPKNYMGNGVVSIFFINHVYKKHFKLQEITPVTGGTGMVIHLIDGPLQGTIHEVHTGFCPFCGGERWN
jgi:hypothetical protein